MRRPAGARQAPRRASRRPGPRRRTGRAAAVLVAAGLTLPGLGCSGGGGEGDDAAAPAGRPVPALVASTVVAGGSGRERALLRAVVDGMEQTTLRRITIGPADARRQTESGKAVAVAFTPIAGATARRQWDQWVVAGAFSRRLLAAGLPAVVDGSDAGGAFTAAPTVEGEPDPQPPSAARAEEVVQAIRGAAERSGATVAGLEVGRPYGLAVALSLTADEPARFLASALRPLLEELDGQREQLEGIYVAVLDGSGRLALEWGSWIRNPAGSYWVRRDLANCSPIRQSDPPGTAAPPPCPV